MSNNFLKSALCGVMLMGAAPVFAQSIETQASRTSPSLSWRSSLKCPAPYNRQFCYGQEMSRDGRFAYMLETADSGTKEVKLHIYRVNESGKFLNKVLTINNLSGYPTPVSDVMVSADGSVVMTWQRKYSKNKGHNTQVVAYRISGSTAQRIASIGLPSQSGGAYTKGELSDDGQFLMVDKLLYRFTGSGFQLINLAGTDIDWRSGNGNDNLVKWSQGLRGFVQVDKHNGAGYLIKRNTSGIWMRTRKFDLPSGSNHNAINMDISDNGNKMVVITRDSGAGAQKMAVYNISNDVFTRKVVMDMPNSNPTSRSSDSSEIIFSSGNGNFILVSGFEGKEIRQYDARNLNLANLPIVSRIPTPQAGQNGKYTRMTRSGKDHVLLSYWAGESPVPLEILSFVKP